jgi:hypothetical protein
VSRQTVAQAKALASYNALLNQQAEARRKARIEAAKQRLIRRFVREKSGYLYAFLSAGVALGVVIVRVYQ